MAYAQKKREELSVTPIRTETVELLSVKNSISNLKRPNISETVITGRHACASLTIALLITKNSEENARNGYGDSVVSNFLYSIRGLG